jgi:dephospho-CoA kinase
MKVLGITGGIAMGKSVAARLLRARGIPVIDTDDVAHQIVEPGQPALAEVVSAFGDQILTPDGRLNRQGLASQVFGDPAALRQLEQILHPRIREVWRAQVASWAAAGNPLAAVVIPLLFETQAQTESDATVCVACSAGTQQLRLRERGWSRDQIEQRLAAQLPIEQKISQSDYVVWTEAGVEVHAEQLGRIFQL